MVIFHFSQFEHESFWQYLFGFSDYRAQYVHFIFEKGETCNILLDGVTHMTRVTLKSMCHIGICSSIVNDTWDLFESWLGINDNLNMLLRLLCAFSSLL